MPTTGLPGNIWYPDDTSPVAPLENLFLTQATSVNVAFDDVNTQFDRREIHTFRRTTLSLLGAITGLVAGDRGYVSGATGNGEYVWSGSAWVAAAVTRHAEYSTTNSIPNGATSSVGTMTLDAGASENVDFITLPSAGVVRLAAGLYAISFTIFIGAATTGLSIVGLAVSGNLYRNYLTNGGSYGLMTVPNLRVTADNTDVDLYVYQTTGATRTVTGRAAITKIG